MFPFISSSRNTTRRGSNQPLPNSPTGGSSVINNSGGNTTSSLFPPLQKLHISHQQPPPPLHSTYNNSQVSPPRVPITQPRPAYRHSYQTTSSANDIPFDMNKEQLSSDSGSGSRNSPQYSRFSTSSATVNTGGPSSSSRPTHQRTQSTGTNSTTTRLNPMTTNTTTISTQRPSPPQERRSSLPIIYDHSSSISRHSRENSWNSGVPRSTGQSRRNSSSRSSNSISKTLPTTLNARTPSEEPAAPKPTIDTGTTDSTDRSSTNTTINFSPQNPSTTITSPNHTFNYNHLLSKFDVSTTNYFLHRLFNGVICCIHIIQRTSTTDTHSHSLQQLYIPSHTKHRLLWLSPDYQFLHYHTLNASSIKGSISVIQIIQTSIIQRSQLSTTTKEINPKYCILLTMPINSPYVVIECLNENDARDTLVLIQWLIRFHGYLRGNPNVVTQGLLHQLQGTAPPTTIQMLQQQVQQYYTRQQQSATIATTHTRTSSVEIPSTTTTADYPVLQSNGGNRPIPSQSTPTHQQQQSFNQKSPSSTDLQQLQKKISLLEYENQRYSKDLEDQNHCYERQAEVVVRTIQNVEKDNAAMTQLIRTQFNTRVKGKQ